MGSISPFSNAMNNGQNNNLPTSDLNNNNPMGMNPNYMNDPMKNGEAPGQDTGNDNNCLLNQGNNNLNNNNNEINIVMNNGYNSNPSEGMKNDININNNNNVNNNNNDSNNMMNNNNMMNEDNNGNNSNNNYNQMNQMNQINQVMNFQLISKCLIF